MNEHTQVLVIGGGPAGSTSACLLARAGFDVTLVDREVFPRYHIGESLLPGTVDIYDLMGAREKIEQSGYPRKYGSHFEWGTDQWSINFADGLGNRIYGFHVDRTSFDQLLLEHARSQGVKVFEGIAIESLSFDGDRPKEAAWAQVVGGTDQGSISFDYLIDASGRAGLITTRYLKNRRYHQAFQNVAIWGYWENAKRLENAPEGAIAIIAVPDGWFWGIPLPDNRMSVGLVIHKKAFQAKKKQTPSLEQIYLEAIKNSPRIADLVKPGKLVSSMRVEQDYSYTGDSFSGPGYFIAGDAACFLDPLLSTGVHLAMFSALLASACILSVSRGEIEEGEAATFYSESYRQTYLRLLVLVSSLYQQYRGKESYFWDAQQLTRHDYNSRDLSAAFRSIMSGQEDMKDIASAPSEPILTRVTELYGECIKGLQDQNPGQAMAEEDREKAQAVFKQLNAVISPCSLSPEKAVDGWYVRMRPQLGLVRLRSASDSLATQL